MKIRFNNMNINRNKLNCQKCFLTLIITLGLFFNYNIASADMKNHQYDEVPIAGADGSVPLLEGLYAIDFPVSTKNEKARAYFNQGLVLTYGFDHSDAEVSFLEAIKYDHDLAMAYWGVAFVLGPNINAPMEKANVYRAYQMVQKALSLVDKASDKERDLVEALARRYGSEPLQDRSSLDRAFADAMQKVYQKYPDDPDITVLYAEAMMDLHPWDYWTEDYRPRPWTPAVKNVLEKAVRRHPGHPHVHHLYIHLMENSPDPEAAVKSADMILNIVPASGHLVHMAGHAYYAAGMYNDCSRANEKALGVDRMLISSFNTSGFYQLAYVPHVLHYLLASYMMEGRSTEAIHAARTLANGIDPKMMRKSGMGTLQHYYLAPYYTLVRFGRWEEILKEPSPAGDLIYPLGMWHYARGMAFSRKGDTMLAETEHESLLKIMKDPVLESVTIWDINRAKDLLEIASDVLTGEIFAAKGETEKALDYLERGVRKETALPFDEPPPWYFPVNQALGTLLLEAGQVERAESVFRNDLKRNPENPWSLFGLAVCLKKSGRHIETADFEKRFRRAWARADIEIQRPIF
jgi:tetratricopeptide (TPR) repeat protein